MCADRLPRVWLVWLLIFFSSMDASGQETPPRPPLKETDVVKLLVAKVSPIRIRSLVRKYGIAFQVEPSLGVLTAAGADPDLINVLREVEPAAAPPAVPAGPSATATPERAKRVDSPAPSGPGPAPSSPAPDPAFVLVHGARGDVYLAKHEVTNEEYWDYCRRFKLPRPPRPPLGKPTPRWPVVNVTWDDAVRYCNALSKESGRMYRLPTEVEWELGASGGDPGRRYPWGAASPKGRACFGKGVLCPAGTFEPNNLGLRDMAGSVAEWVAAPGVVKGGSWQTVDNFRSLEISSRVKIDPKKRSSEVGFRVAMEP